MWIRSISMFVFIVACPVSAMGSDFSDALAHAVANHPAIKAEYQGLQVAKEGIGEAFSGYMPTVAASYDRGRKRLQFNNGAKEYNDAMTRTISVSQPIFQGGETLAGHRASKAQF